ncbi:unnamed protein product [Musa acuminata var. zebrina]
MAGSPLPVVAALLFFVSSLVFRVSLATMQPLCPRLSVPFLDDLGSQCPRWIELPLRQEVSGETLERYLNCGDQYCSVLFGVSWCPFSRNIQPIFHALSSMFPQIKHLLVEESSIMPSVLSRNGIHSFPAIMLINQTSRIRYHGPKNLNSLVHFYKKSTGLNPIMYLAIDQSGSGNVKSPVLEVESASELITKEPYLTFGIIYIGLKIIICSFSAIYSCFKAFWVSHAWHLNLSFLRESSQLLEQMLHVVEVNGLWSNLRFCNKTSNFQKGANNARAWASSFTSVSLGESSSSRLASSDSS